MIDGLHVHVCFRWTSQRVLNPSLKQERSGFWVGERNDLLFTKMYNYSCNFEFRNRLQKINPFRAIFWASSLAPRYSLHRLRELASSSTFPFVDFWLFSLVICFSQSALVIWQIRHGPNMFGLVNYPVSQSRFKFWLIKTFDLKSYVYTTKF